MLEYYLILFAFFFLSYIAKINDPSNLKLLMVDLSTIHASVITILSTFYILYPIISYVQYIAFISPFSVGYCITDLFYLLFSAPKLDKEMVFHHSVFLIFMTPYFLEKYTEQIALASLSELSTVFLNTCYLMYNSREGTSSPYFREMTIATLVSYFFTRCVNFTYISFFAFSNSYYDALSMCLPLTILNYIWFWRLVAKRASTLSQVKQKKVE